ncbi:MAG: Sec-independent protein translocase protein TatB [Deltaproteobacteria bacterium]|jgi:sec-independent protein translocase protein TatB|nr:Sec-independent protein translocase protein TatB [Deltaproteobacteria bacterium]
MAPGIGWTEILFIILVALVVVKPERLPETVRTVARLWGDARRYLAGLTASLKKELTEIQTLSELQDLKNLKDPLKDLKLLPEDPLGREDPFGVPKDLTDPTALKSLNPPTLPNTRGPQDASSTLEPQNSSPNWEKVYPELSLDAKEATKVTLDSGDGPKVTPTLGEPPINSGDFSQDNEPKELATPSATGESLPPKSKDESFS